MAKCINNKRKKLQRLGQDPEADIHLKSLRATIK